MKNIATLTMNPSIDISTTVDNVVAERKLRCDSPQHEPGGGGINVSRAVRKLGGESTAFFAAGGATGDFFERLLDAEDIRRQSLVIEGSTRESFMVYEKSTGQQYRFGMPGPTLGKKEWQGCIDRLFQSSEKADLIVASGSLPPGIPPDFYGRVAHRAKAMGIKTVVDCTGEPFQEALNEGVYLIKPNIRELRSLARDPLDDESGQEAFARKLVEARQAEVVVVSLGAAGALMVSREESRRLRAPTVPIESKVGAGDSMVAGIVLGLVRKMSMSEAVRLGVAAGAAAVMTPGSELCRKEDTERLYGKIKNE